MDSDTVFITVHERDEMKLLTEGDRGRAICSRCEALVTTTFRRCDLPFSDGSGFARDIIAGFCDECACVVSTPAQSTPAIAAALRMDDSAG